jgi:RNase P subunit RPR2
MAFNLSDDGTLDTVVTCSECGAELRYNFDGDMEAGQTRVSQREQDAI